MRETSFAALWPSFRRREELRERARFVSRRGPPLEHARAIGGFDVSSVKVYLLGVEGSRP